MRHTQGSFGRFGRRIAGKVRGGGAARNDRAKRATFERLEDRRLLALTTPIISEFLAINDSGIQDENGNRSDWVELYNPTASDVNLDGYFLTDDATDLDKWRFPAVTLPSGGYLVVWASAKDRAVAGSPLHTNFNLDGALGEYLALVAPGGTTPVSEFSPTFPPMGSDVSYGVATSQSTDSLIGPRNTARARVPSAADNFGTDWTSPTFNDSAWTAGTTGVGYETDSPPPATPGFRVRMVNVSAGTRADISTVDDAAAILNSPDGTAAGAYVVQTDTTVARTVINMGPGGSYGGDEILPNGLASDDLYAVRSTATVTIPAGEWTINANSDDGFRLRMPGVTFATPNNGELSAADTFQFAGLRGAGNSFVTFTVPAGGLTTSLQLDFFENQGGDSIELSIAAGARTSFSTGTFSLLGNGVLGWGAFDPVTVGPPNYRSLIGTDVQAQMYNVSTTAYVRVPFSVANANDYETLRMQMKYDDGFVAYLNGVEVARRNAPLALPYNAQATASRPDDQALVYESFSIPASALRTGSNVLAVQALNATVGSSDLLIYPEIQGFITQVGTAPRFYAQPTPGAANTTPASLGVVADTKFSVNRGFFDAPFDLAITTATEGAEIRYTTNGTAPTADNGTVYAGPITVSATTTVRAAAFKAGFVPANVDTQTYLFLDDVIRQAEGVRPSPEWPLAGSVNGQVIDYGMDQGVVNANIATIKEDLKKIPSFSIVMKTGDLFDPATGIYVNPSGDGLPWERGASLELLYPDGTKGFQIDAGIRIRGGFSRSGGNPKHAFRFFFRNKYDGNLNFPVFGANAAQSFNGFDLRTFQNYSWSFGGDSNGTFMRDQLNRDLQLAMGHDAERGDYYHLYINGQYWGLYNTAERAEANHGADYFGGVSEDYDVIKVDPDLGYNIEATDGNMDAWNQLYTLLKGPITESVLQQVQGNNPDGTRNPAFPVLLDVGNLIDYMLIIYYGGNLDAPISNFLGNNSPNNFFALRNRTGNEGFRFYVHDAEHTMLPWDAGNNRLGPTPGTGWAAGSQGVGKSNPQYFFQRLWSLPTFKLLVADQVQKHMVNSDGLLTPVKVSAAMNRRKAEIDRAVIGESARWGDAKVASPYTRATWLNAVSAVQGWIGGRTGTVLNQLRQWGLFPSYAAPRFSQQGGQVPQGYQLSILNAAGQPAGSSIYYTLDGSDPRRPDGSVSPTAILYAGPITVNDSTLVKARSLNGTTWSPVNIALFTLDIAALRITELMYNPAPAPAGSPFTRGDFEFLEVMNIGAAERDLTGVRIAGGIDFLFPADYRLAPGARALVVKNRAAFESRYGAGLNVVPGVFAGQLSDAGELLQLQSATGQTSLTFTYDDEWYPQTDGEGFSLNINDPAGTFASFNLKASWSASDRNGGTPGAPNDALPGGTVVVNEILASPEAGSTTGDFIELRNTTPAAIDLSGWFLSDDPLNPRKFRIPDGTTIAANAYLAFDQGQLGFDIASTPGEVFVSNGDAAGNLRGYRHSKRYGAGDAGFSFGEYLKSTGGTDFIALRSPTPGAANGSPRVGPVVINELMYHPPSSGGVPEFIELRNLSGAEVLLHDPADPASAWKFVDGITYTFPAGATIPAFGYALVVPVDAVAFRNAYSVPPGVPIYGGYQEAGAANLLSDVGENLTLYRPTPAGDVLVDRVNYTRVAPWPVGASGSGYSIARVDSNQYGNEGTNWALDDLQQGGTPGRVNLDGDAPTADIVDVSPDPRTTPVDAITFVFSEPVQGFDVSDVWLTRDGGANLLTADVTLSSADAITWTLGGLAGLTSAPGAYILRFNGAGSNVTDWNYFTVSGEITDTWRVGGAPAGRVVGRSVFYNNSAFDGASASAGVADDGAIASDKQALLPGQAAGFTHYTSFSRGLNGLMVDLSGLAVDLTAADFIFDVGNDADLSSWTRAPAPVSVTRRAGAGVGGADRITLLWADRAIKNQWLRVTVLANTRTDLPAADVFYFGNLVGETGDSATAAAVTAADVLAVRSNLFKTGLAVTHTLDFNRDGRVNTADFVIARGAVANNSLTLLTTSPTVGATAAVFSSKSATTFGDTAIAPSRMPAVPPARSRPARRSVLAAGGDVLGRA